MLLVGIGFGFHSLLLAQSGKPILIGIEVPTTVTPSEPIEILIRARNDGPQVERGYITVSFPDVDTEMQFTSLSTQTNVKRPGDTIIQNVRAANGSYMSTNARYYLIESAFGAWETGGERELRFQITSTESISQVTSYIRATLCNGSGANIQCTTAPATSDIIDQQGFPVEERVTRIGESGGDWGAILLGLLLFGILIGLISNGTEKDEKSPPKSPITKLQEAVYEAFGADLQKLCLDLDVRGLYYTALPGEDDRERTNAIVEYLYRREEIPELIRYCKTHAPNRDWKQFRGAAPVYNRRSLYETLSHRFNRAELRALCIQVGIDYENWLAGSTLEEKVESLVGFCYRHNYFGKLSEAGIELRNDVNWGRIEFKGPEDESDLIKVLTERFDERELDAFSAELGVAYSQLPGDTQEKKAQALVSLLRAKIALGNLVSKGRKLRDDIDWSCIRL
jgi:hypothetical protein